MMTRVAFLAAAAYAFASGLRLYEAAGIWPPAIPLGLTLYLGALLALLGAFWIRHPGGRSAQWFIASLLLVALVSSVALEISVSNPRYGTDAIAFAHVGAEVLLDGNNPYGVVGEPLAPIIERFGIPETFVTRNTSGDPIDRLISYPGGHVLAYAGTMAIGMDDLRWGTLIFQVAALAVIWWAMSPQGRLFIPLVLLVEPNLSVFFTSGGVTDWLWVLPLVVSAIMLHREQWGYAGLALGLACAVKQQPWFAVPFVIIWALMQMRNSGDERSLARNMTSLATGIFAGFAVMNLPFLFWGPQDWFGGVFTPLMENLVPDGQGLSLLASRGFIPLPQAAFSFALIVAFGIALIVYYRRFDRMGNLLWVLPPALLFLSHRSLHNYFIFWIPVAGLWLDLEMGRQGHSVPLGEHTVEGSTERKRAPLVAAIVAIVASCAIGIYLVSDTDFQVGSVTAEVRGGVVTALQVQVTNTGAEAIEPVFEVYWGRYPVPWKPAEPTMVPHGETAVVRIVPTSSGVIPPLVSNEDGLLESKPFRVRVNEAGNSTYRSSGLVRLAAVGESVINPGFDFWGDAGGGSADAPYGWTSDKIALPGSSAQTRTMGAGRGVSLTASQRDPGVGGWAEAAVIQNVASISSCYRMRVFSDFDYTANGEGRPLAAAGLQVLQGNSAAWFVLADSEETRVTELPEGTSIVQVPASSGQWQELTFDLSSIGSDSGFEPGKAGTIKLFSALHETQPGPQEMRVTSIEGC